MAARSFVGGSAYRDDQGHGTFVAGEIAANPFNNDGIAGIAFNARLMIAKVVRAYGTVSLPAEVAAIHWAVDNGARVINLSLGGVRDPLDPSLDTYSPLEQKAEGIPDALELMAEQACRDKLPLGAAVEKYERWLLEAALKQNGGNRTRTAAELGLSPRSIFNKLKKYQLE